MAREIVIRGRVLRWGHSYGVRLRKNDLKRAGLADGAEVTLRLGGAGDRVDLSKVPAFRGGRRDDARRHDDLLGESRNRRGRKA